MSERTAVAIGGTADELLGPKDVFHGGDMYWFGRGSESYNRQSSSHPDQ